MRAWGRMANLYCVAASSEPSCHVIFVHGLGGHPLETWQSEKNNLYTLWPRWVAEDLSDCSVWTIGYQAPPTNYTGKALDLNSRALTLLELLGNL